MPDLSTGAAAAFPRRCWALWRGSLRPHVPRCIPPPHSPAAAPPSSSVARRTATLARRCSRSRSPRRCRRCGSRWWSSRTALRSSAPRASGTTGSPSTGPRAPSAAAPSASAQAGRRHLSAMTPPRSSRDSRGRMGSAAWSSARTSPQTDSPPPSIALTALSICSCVICAGHTHP